jgi:hypothetical protein
MAEQALTAVRALAAGRIAVGASLLVAPTLAAQWAGEDARAPGARVITRAAAARDVALGVGTLALMGDRALLRRWLLVSSACDAVDFAATLAGPRAPGRTLVLAMAGAATALGLAAAASV